MLLFDVVAARRKERSLTLDPKRADRLDREIEFLSQQLTENHAIVASCDMSPGLGYIGFYAYEGP